MDKNESDWIGVSDAASLCGRSVSTMRRLIPELTGSKHLRRERFKGGEKVLFSRSHLVERFGVFEHPQSEAQKATQDAEGVENVVRILESQIAGMWRQIDGLQRDGETKSRVIEDAQRTILDLTESLKQFASLTAALQGKILELGAGERKQTGNDFWYLVSVAVGISLVLGLAIFVFLQWVGE